MRHFQIYSASSGLFETDPIIDAKTGREALSQYFKTIGFNGKVKPSGDNNVHFKVTPLVIRDGVKYYDGRGRVVWYQIQNS